jgi:TusA-related sulfurtransferase
MTSELDPMAEPSTAASLPSILDLRGTPCPINFVRIKLKLAQMRPGESLEAWLDAGEPIEQVPDSLRMEGYIIEAIAHQQNYFVLKVVCPE